MECGVALRRSKGGSQAVSRSIQLGNGMTMGRWPFGRNHESTLQGRPLFVSKRMTPERHQQTSVTGRHQPYRYGRLIERRSRSQRAGKTLQSLPWCRKFVPTRRTLVMVPASRGTGRLESRRWQQVLPRPGSNQLRSGFGSYVGAAAYGAGSCFDAVLHAASNSTKIMALRRAIVDVVFICRYLFRIGFGKAVFALGVDRSHDTRNRLFLRDRQRDVCKATQ
jgi:hypothetical protein